MYAVSKIELGRDAEGLALLAEVAGREPDNPRWMYELARYRFLKGQADQSEVESAITRLESSPFQPAGSQYASQLKAILAERHS